MFKRDKNQEIVFGRMYIYNASIVIPYKYNYVYAKREYYNCFVAFFPAYPELVGIAHSYCSKDLIPLENK